MFLACLSSQNNVAPDTQKRMGKTVSPLLFFRDVLTFSLARICLLWGHIPSFPKDFEGLVLFGFCVFPRILMVWQRYNPFVLSV